MARKNPPALQKWLIPQLRRLAMRWPGKAKARDNAKVYIDDGVFKNGNVRTRAVYECAECKRQGLVSYLHEKENTQMDHINPVVSLDGFNNWDEYVNQLFCAPEGFQCLCKPHHNTKTQKENKTRFKNRLTRSKNRANISKDANNGKPKKLLQKSQYRRSKRTLRKRHSRLT